ncbi:MAG TPA: hypothetical protein VHV08_12825, partial [Pirellulales bacterium]|nr:hypothetical protein [Pirellulales bacterium]
PYMSYRPVVTAAYAPVAAPAVAAAYYAPAAPVAAAPCCGAAGYAPAPAAGVPSGAVGTPVPSLGPPPGYSPAPVPSAAPQGPYAPGLAPSGPPTTPPSASPPDQAAPDGSSPNTSSPNKTFNDAPEGQPAQPQSRLIQPPPNFNNSSTMGAPRALDPEDQDRTTALPLHRTLAARPVSTVTTSMEDSNDGWRPSSR